MSSRSSRSGSVSSRWPAVRFASLASGCRASSTPPRLLSGRRLGERLRERLDEYEELELGLRARRFGGGRLHAGGFHCGPPTSRWKGAVCHASSVSPATRETTFQR